LHFTDVFSIEDTALFDFARIVHILYRTPSRVSSVVLGWTFMCCSNCPQFRPYLTYSDSRIIACMHQSRVKTYALLFEGMYWLYMLKVLVSYCIVFIIEETAFFVCGDCCNLVWFCRECLHRTLP